MNRFETNEIFLSPGNYASALYFIQTGLVRGSIEASADKMTTWFKKEGDLIIPAGLFNQHPSEEYFNAVIKTTVLQLPLKHINQVLETTPEFRELIILLLLESLAEGQQREKLLRMPAAKDRYNYLAKHEDYILKRVPHYLIASYLNVTKETFSRLHKGLSY
ncbi:Crp/Fnr family transcriptional regulator [Mucilaginibacter lacusdianchii]|uniref:Crp/Fnr family transcriptional regulator n=1 Tax=Mucilaginibacter lacusdianchii TaxID=2684211 RepID=UPI00131DB6F2|nr:Crp/Fnr family transcriptional regulator [Mucilaginibacter sp. JXJ CY 39]